jgi:hypothetical protein
MNTNDMLISTGISIACFILYKSVQRCYTKYYLTSECHQRSIEIFVVDIEEEKKQKNSDEKNSDEKKEKETN